MITLTAEKIRIIVSSYEWLMELSSDEGFQMRPEELALYRELKNSLTLNVSTVFIEPFQAGGLIPADAVDRSVGGRTVPIPAPPQDPHREEDPYVPNVSE